MELFSTGGRRATLAQISNKFEMFLCQVLVFHKCNSSPLGPKRFFISFLYLKSSLDKQPLVNICKWLLLQFWRFSDSSNRAENILSISSNYRWSRSTQNKPRPGLKTSTREMTLRSTMTLITRSSWRRLERSLSFRWSETWTSCHRLRMSLTLSSMRQQVNQYLNTFIPFSFANMLSSVTILGEILPLWQNSKNIWRFLRAHLISVKILSLLLRVFCY